jgi:hypothetical protein
VFGEKRNLSRHGSPVKLFTPQK